MSQQCGEYKLMNMCIHAINSWCLCFAALMECGQVWLLLLELVFVGFALAISIFVVHANKAALKEG